MPFSWIASAYWWSRSSLALFSAVCALTLPLSTSTSTFSIGRSRTWKRVFYVVAAMGCYPFSVQRTASGLSGGHVQKFYLSVGLRSSAGCSRMLDLFISWALAGWARPRASCVSSWARRWGKVWPCAWRLGGWGWSCLRLGQRSPCLKTRQ